jgi:hypothetical protein
MTRAIDHATFTQARVEPWYVQWEQARGKYTEKRVLMEIAASALNRDYDVWMAAYDAATATDPDERAEHIATLERLFDEAAEAEAFAEQCEAYEIRTGKDWTSCERLMALEQTVANPQVRLAAGHLKTLSGVK